MNHLLASRSRLVAVAAISVGGLATLVALPTDPGSVRVSEGSSAVPRWLWSLPDRSVDPIEIIAAGARSVAVVALSYLVLIAAANLLVSFVPRARRRGPGWRVLHTVTPRWLAVASVGVVIGAGPVAAAQPSGGPVGGRPAPVMEVIGSAAVAPADAAAASKPSSTTAPPTSTARDEATGLPRAVDTEAPAIDPASPLQPVPNAADPDTAVSSGTVSGSGPVASAPTVPAGAPSADQLPPSAAVHRVQPGEHFWSIAEQVVIERDGPTASDAAVTAYWRRLVEANRDRLVDPEQPDLIHPGQVFDLPW